jgi:acyl-CoA synthetase (AMP-forming)/AMP-acid ligase II
MARFIGFWKNRVEKYINTLWFESDEYKACLKYLQTGRTSKRYKGYAKCRLCGTRLGTTDMITSDGKWIFPEKYEHYLIEHKVKPNKAQFIRDAVAWNKR